LFISDREERSNMAATPNVAVGGPVTQVQEPSPGSSIPFRRATTFRVAQLQSTAQLVTAGAQQVDVVIEGSGYVYGIDLHISATTAANAAATAFQEDGPWSAIDTAVFRDVNGELVNLTGYHLRLMNLYGGYVTFKDAPVRGETAPSADTGDIFNVITGAGGTGGSFRFHLFIPVGLNRRDLRAILGNQDRANKYSLRTDFAASASIWSTAPTTLPTMSLERYYENYAVPAPRNANGAPQEQMPPDFGIFHYLTQSVSPSAPQGSATVNHYLARLGNTVRLLVLVLRANGSRATAETACATSTCRASVPHISLVSFTVRRSDAAVSRVRASSPGASATATASRAASCRLPTLNTAVGPPWRITQSSTPSAERNSRQPCPLMSLSVVARPEPASASVPQPHAGRAAAAADDRARVDLTKGGAGPGTRSHGRWVTRMPDRSGGEPPNPCQRAVQPRLRIS
jgi:hypothetical protein